MQIRFCIANSINTKALHFPLYICIPPKLLSFSNISIEFNKLNLSKKMILKIINLESDINELEMSLDHMNKANAEESKQIKR